MNWKLSSIIKSNSIYLGIISLFFFSCNKSKNGYDKTASGLEYKYIIKNDSTKQVSLNDYMVMDVKYFTDNDSLLFSTESFTGKFRMKYKEASKKADINEALGMLRIGDSASFKVDAKIFFENTRHETCPEKLIGTKVRFEIALRDVQNEKTVLALKQELSARQQEKENTLLEDFIIQNYPDCKPTKSGLYIVTTKKGTGVSPKNGNKVAIHYIAHFINGEIFTNSYKKKIPFEFTLGKQEVIEGLEEGLQSMKLGGKSIFIIPSKLAYGVAGRKPVPANATLIFETELISVK